MQWKDLRTPLYCALAAWLYMFTRKDPIPFSAVEQAKHYQQSYDKPVESIAAYYVEEVVVMEKIKEGN